MGRRVVNVGVIGLGSNLPHDLYAGYVWRMRRLPTLYGGYDSRGIRRILGVGSFLCVGSLDCIYGDGIDVGAVRSKAIRRKGVTHENEK